MDHLSQLPEDIMLLIASFLPMKDVARTSVLSKYWIKYWKLYLLHVSHDLNFNTSTFIKPQDLMYPALESLHRPALTSKFVKWVNKVLNDPDLQVLHKLRIQFPLELDEQFVKQIDEWVSYAFARKVSSLELDFMLYSSLRMIKFDHYVFPHRLVDETYTDFSYMRSLSLSGIDVYDEDIVWFLSKFPFLEHLKVCRSSRLENVQISSSSRALKHLEILYCPLIPVITIRETCLVSLTLTSKMNLVLENNPNLVSLHFVYEKEPKNNFQVLFSCPKLQNLTLCLKYCRHEVFDRVFQLSELKHLTLVVPPTQNDIYVPLTALINSSPNIEKLVLEFIVPKFEGKVVYNKGTKILLQHLKTIEVCGYCGEEAEDDLLLYVLEQMVAPIKRLIFDPHTLRWNTVRECETIAISDEKRVEKLRRIIPSSIEFIVR